MSKHLPNFALQYQLPVEHSSLVFVDGKFEHSLSKFDKQTDALIKEHLLVKNNGFIMHIPRNTAVINPVQILFLCTNQQENTANIQNTFNIGEMSEITIIEEFVSCSDNACSHQVNTSFELEKNATMHFYKIQNENILSTHEENLKINQAPNSTVNTVHLGVGGKNTCDRIEVLLDGENSRCNLDGLYSLRKQQNSTYHLVVEHHKPNCSSKVLFKGIVDDSAQATFDGKIMMQAEAIGSFARLNNRNLLLSDAAQVTTKPALEIYVDDVQCTHGATVGQLDQAALWYLQSRGIPAKEARQMLVDGFAREITAKFPEFLQMKLNSLSQE